VLSNRLLVVIPLTLHLLHRCKRFEIGGARNAVKLLISSQQRLRHPGRFRFFTGHLNVADIMPSALAPAPPAPASPGNLGELQPALGFKIGVSGAHSARTMMLDDLSALIAAAPKGATRQEFNRLVVDENALGKRTTSNRWLTARHLADLYGMDAGIPVFRSLRVFWEHDTPGRPLLAMLCAQARDPLLRTTSDLVLAMKPGETLTSARFAEHFQRAFPDRFSESMLRSLAQNIASSWAQAGFFSGKVRKVRTRPITTPATAAFSLVLGYLCGLRGQILVESGWTRLLDVSRTQIVSLAQEAARRNWLDFKAGGSVYEIAFPQILTQREIKASHGTD